MPDPVLFVGVRADMPLKHQAIQAMHACFELGLAARAVDEKAATVPDVPLIAYQIPGRKMGEVCAAMAGTEDSLVLSSYQDPYFGDAVTAFVVLASRAGETHRVLADFQLAFE